MNHDQKDTFSKNGRCFKIDLTFVSEPLVTSFTLMVSDVHPGMLYGTQSSCCIIFGRTSLLSSHWRTFHNRGLKRIKEYCAIITLDIKIHSFKSSDSSLMLVALDEKDVPNCLLELIKDYFKDGVHIYDTDDGRKSILWNVVYDAVLGFRHLKGTQIIGFDSW